MLKPNRWTVLCVFVILGCATAFTMGEYLKRRGPRPASPSRVAAQVTSAVEHVAATINLPLPQRGQELEQWRGAVASLGDIRVISKDDGATIATLRYPFTSAMKQHFLQTHVSPSVRIERGRILDAEADLRVELTPLDAPEFRQTVEMRQDEVLALVGTKSG